MSADREEELVDARQEVDDDSDGLDEEESQILTAIREKKKAIRYESRLKHARNSTAIPEAKKKVAHPMRVDALGKHLRGRGVDASDAAAIVDRVRSRSREGRPVQRDKRKRKRADDAITDSMDLDSGEKRIGRSASRDAESISRSRSRGPAGRPRSDSILRGRSLTPAPGDGFKDAKAKERAIKSGDRAQRKRNKMARQGEGDRHVYDERPKHLHSGARPRN